MSQVERVGMNESRRYTNGVLTIMAVLLGAIALQGAVGLPGASEAQAQRSRRSSEKAEPFTPLNSAAQRARIITELERISERLSTFESAFEGPFDVRVTELPQGAMTNVFNPGNQQR